MLLMAPLLRWGLPDRQRDELLFGGQPAWQAERYDAARVLQERQQRQSGADTDLNPLTERDRIILLTADEGARAEILRRYRLFSRQPDEMITFMALQRMQPRRFDFDPKLYQYGGGYIYLIAAAIGISSALQIVDVTGDVGMYLEQPELFAGFYIVARVITLLFGALLLLAVWKLARRAAGRMAGWFAMLGVACTPVFITGVLEAKPHLPSACMLLWAVLSGLDYYAHGRSRAALRMGLQAGYAFGLVLTGLVAAVLWPVLLLARRDITRRQLVNHLLCAAGLAIAVYLLTNPYILYNYLFDRQSLASNISNSTAMYANQIRQAAMGAVRVAELLVESCGLGVIGAGLIGFVRLLRRWPRETWLVAVSGLAMLLICVLLGAGKPAEFARFLILPVSLLCIAAAALLVRLARRQRLLALIAGCVVLWLMRTPAYINSFAVDAADQNESRHLAAQYLREHANPDDSIGLLQEPAPYAVPPLDFAHREVLWLPPSEPTQFDRAELPPWLVFTADEGDVHVGDWWTPHYRQVIRLPSDEATFSQIAWANKPVFVYRRISNSSSP